MTEDDVLELLDEARLACGRKADALAAYCGARIPNSESVARFVVEGYIHRFTGKHVKLPAREEPEDVVKQSGQFDEKLTSPLSLPLDPLYALEHGLCSVCGLPLAIGDWPCITTIRPHGRSVQTDPFVTYFDVGLGREVTSLADRWNGMKAEPGDAFTDGRPKLEYRDHPSKGDLAARRDRLEERKREQRRGNSA